MIDNTNVINAMFKSMTISGKANVKNIDGKDITNDIYVDLSENNYFLNESIQQTNVIFSGRRGTGKTTIFLAAKNMIEKNSSKILPIYINLQSCYEQLDLNNPKDSTILTQKNFLIKIFEDIKKSMSLPDKVKQFMKVKSIFSDIENGTYFNSDIENSVLTENNKQDVISANMGLGSNINIGKSNENKKSVTNVSKRILSISPILESLKEVSEKMGINSIILFLDDFSELDESDQKLITDNIISPIISSYNDFFKIKLATYPGRLHLGNIDATKVISKSLDFYDVYKANETKSIQIEKKAIDFIERTLKTRLNVFSNNELGLENIFDIDQTNSKEIYLKLLFDCSAAIPRNLGFILDIAYETSMNRNEKIKISDIKSATQKYYEENIYKDFYNDYRYKQSFADKEKSLTREYQKKLFNELIDNAQNVKEKVVSDYQKNQANDLFKKTIESNPISLNQKWFPTSHFYINKKYEYLLDTLELHFLANKIQENSNKSDPKITDSVYALNYGLCLSNKIDYGQPTLRRSYDFWRSKEFNIGEILSSFEKSICSSCETELSESEYDSFIKFNRCPACGKTDCVSKKSYLSKEDLINIYDKDNKNLENKTLYPDKLIEILRLLENNPDTEYSAHDIANKIDSHHLPVTNYIRMISSFEFILKEQRDKYYYKKNPEKSFFN